MTDGIENTPIVVVGNVPSNPFELMSDFMPRARADPSQIVMILPVFGEVNGHSIVVIWDGQVPPLKPSLVNTQITNLRDAYVRVGEVISSLSDAATYHFGPTQLTGQELKAAYFSLTRITVTDYIYANGYGGLNLGQELQIGVGTSAGWGVHGIGAYNFIMLHEMVHNSIPGRALAQQMWDRHLAAGGSSSNYGASNSFFEQQESMTNSLVREIAEQIDLEYNSSVANAPGYPRYGYYSGPELNPQP